MHDHAEPLALQELKHRAHSLELEQEISHCKALDVAAREAGYGDYFHAQQCLTKTSNTPDPVPPRDLPPSTFRVSFEARWSEFDGFRKGVEHGAAVITRPLREVVRNRACAAGTLSLHEFRWSRSGEKFVLREITFSQVQAMHHVHCASQELWFMDTTGLRPVPRFWDALPRAEVSNEMERGLHALRNQPPGLDHPSTWADKEGRLMLMDQPYPLTERDIDARNAWADRFNYVMALPPYLGTYSRETDCVFFAHRETGAPLAPIVESIDAKIRAWFGRSKAERDQGTSEPS